MQQQPDTIEWPEDRGDGPGLNKRLIDVTVAAIVLAVTAPLLAAAAAWVCFVSRGPALFRQERVGRLGKPFLILKLRTMAVAPRDRPGSTVTVRDDPRVIPGGERLRRLKLDELPQLINVLRGEMSLVGPRPTVVEDYLRMTPRQRGRCRVAPGLTGLAQVRGNTGLLWPERIEHDLEYVEGQSLLLDLKVLMTTARLVLSGRSHTDPPGDNEWRHAA